jgi:hypothetical protein
MKSILREYQEKLENEEFEVNTKYFFQPEGIE